MPWIAVTERLPEAGKMVRVFGEHTPEGHGFPKAYLRDAFNTDNVAWCSTEWRGTVGITHWWEEE